MLASTGYAVVDLETTGLDCWTDLIIEIGVLVVTPTTFRQAESVLVAINGPLRGEIVNLTGINDRLLSRDGIPIDDALGWFTQRVGQLPLIGHNVIRFDRAFLLEAARQHRQAVSQQSRVIDEVDDLPVNRFLDTAALFKGYKLGMTPNPNETHFQYA